MPNVGDGVSDGDVDQREGRTHLRDGDGPGVAVERDDHIVHRPKNAIGPRFGETLDAAVGALSSRRREAGDVIRGIEKEQKSEGNEWKRQLALAGYAGEGVQMSIKQMGAVVKAAKAGLEGKTVDGKALSDRVRERLS